MEKDCSVIVFHKMKKVELCFVLLIILGYCQDLRSESAVKPEQCTSPVVEGSKLTITKHVDKIQRKVQWKSHNGAVTVTECYLFRDPPCLSRLDPQMYTSDIVLREGTYLVSLTIHNVTRTKDATTWKWFDQEKMLGECDLEVLYSPSVSLFRVNSKTDRLEVQNQDRVAFWCDAAGNPRPDLSIWGQRSQKAMTVHETELDKHTTRAGMEKRLGCLDTDLYTCIPHNGVGTGKGKNVLLLVRCSPLFSQGFNHSTNEFSTTNGTMLEIRIPTMSHPVPNPKTFTLTKRQESEITNTNDDAQNSNNNNKNRREKRAVTENEVTTDMYHVTYKPGAFQPEGTVVLRMFDMGKEDSGQYVLTIRNGIGPSLEYAFGVDVGIAVAPMTKAAVIDNKLGTAGAVGVTLAFGIVLAIICFLMGFVTRLALERKEKLKKKRSEQNARHGLHPYNQNEDNSPPHTPNSPPPHPPPSPPTPNTPPPTETYDELPSPPPPSSPPPSRAQNPVDNYDDLNAFQFQEPRRRQLKDLAPKGLNINHNNNNNDLRVSSLKRNLLSPGRNNFDTSNENNNSSHNNSMESFGYGFGNFKLRPNDNGNNNNNNNIDAVSLNTYRSLPSPRQAHHSVARSDSNYSTHTETIPEDLSSAHYLDGYEIPADQLPQQQQHQQQQQQQHQHHHHQQQHESSASDRLLLPPSVNIVNASSSLPEQHDENSSNAGGGSNSEHRYTILEEYDVPTNPA